MRSASRSSPLLLRIPRLGCHWAVAFARFGSAGRVVARAADFARFTFGGSEMPLFLVTVFAKNEKDNLTKAEQSAAVALSKTLLATYGVSGDE